MSLLRSSLHSVIKSVGSTDLKSKFSRFTPCNVAVGGAKAVKAEGTAPSSAPKTASNTEENENSVAEKQQVVKKPSPAGKKVPESRSAVSPTVSPTSSTRKQQLELFHPAALTTGISEMYKFLSRHINTYFATDKEEERGEVATREEDRPSMTHRVLERPPPPPPPKLTSSKKKGTSKLSLELFHPITLPSDVDEISSSLNQHINKYFGAAETQTHEENEKRRVARQQGVQKHQRKLPYGFVRAPKYTKQKLELFHPDSPPSNRDEMDCFLANHINGYFGSASHKDDKKNRHKKVGSGDLVPTVGLLRKENRLPVISPVSSVKREDTAWCTEGFTQYLSNIHPKFQAFVDDQADAKRSAGEKDYFPVLYEGTPSAEKALLHVVGREGIVDKSKALMRNLKRDSDVKLLTKQVEEISFHLLDFPEDRDVSIKVGLLSSLLRLRQREDKSLQSAVRKALAVLGYTDPVKGRGIRVLAIDGGGTRGVLALQALQKLQDLTGKQIYELFDYISGVSTGAILAIVLAMFQMPLEDCNKMYRKLGTSVFSQNVIVGTMKMGWSHAFYDSEMWERLIREMMGEGRMIDSARNPNCPKVSAISSVVNRGPSPKAYVFRNYAVKPGVYSPYMGSCQHKMWEAIRASSAAPGFFQEFALGKDLHQDGGLLINNPTALAIHECKSLWPDTPLQCVVSLGTGRHNGMIKSDKRHTSLKTKITQVINSATDTEGVHLMLDALLPPNTYFRFNPYISEDFPMNEYRDEKLNILLKEGERYLNLNELKINEAAKVLSLTKHTTQRLSEWAKLKADMYNGFPFMSKL